MKRMLKYMKGYGKECVIAPLFKCLEAMFDLFVPIVMASIIDTGIGAGDKPYILKRCGLLVLLALVGLTCSLIAQFFASRAAVGYATRLRHSLFGHIQTLSFSDMDTIGTSTLITRMTSDINQVQTGINLFLRLFMRSPFVVFGSMIMAFTIDVKAALIFVVVIPLLTVVVVGVMLRTMPLYKKVQSKLDSVLGITRENLSGVRVIRAFCCEDEETERFENANGELTKIQLFVGRISSLTNPVTMLIVNLGIIAVLWSGAVRINSGVLQQGTVIALVSYMTQILVELVKLANLIIQVTKSLASAGRINTVLNTEPQMTYAEEAITAEKNDAVCFENVSFRYSGAGEESLSNISFAVKKGETVGIIGGTGSGKSTLVSLIARFYDATSGSVSLFGTSVADYPREQLRSTVGTVMQKAQLFKGTIRSNLLFGNENATDEQLWSALETAQAAEFVREKEDGLDEPVEQGGTNFSGGQRQRLSIARTLVANTKILILDDSASALDFATEAALRKAIAALPNDVTVFIVSQRTSSISHADHIIVLDDGEMVGFGKHTQLIETCPVYREIYESQFRKEDEQR